MLFSVPIGRRRVSIEVVVTFDLANICPMRKNSSAFSRFGLSGTFQIADTFLSPSLRHRCSADQSGSHARFQNGQSVAFQRLCRGHLLLESIVTMRAECRWNSHWNGSSRCPDAVSKWTTIETICSLICPIRNRAFSNVI